MYVAFERLARLMALMGGIVLTLLILVTCISVLGRGINTLAYWEQAGALGAWMQTLGLGPVKGDFEIVEAGIAFSVFAFLPWCQITKGHATVDLFTNALPRRMNHALITFWEIVFAAILILIAVQLYEGTMGKMRNGETTFLLQFPIWWSYAASLVAAVLAAATSVFVAARSLAGLVTGQSETTGHGGGHL